MTSYNLELLIDSQALQVIKSAEQRITLAKAANGDSANVIWLSLDPSLKTQLAWSEEYGIYATSANITNEEPIIPEAETNIPASSGACYTLNSSFKFIGPSFEHRVPSGTYEVENEVPYSAHPSLAFGLTQSAVVNRKEVGKKPLSAVKVIATQRALITPYPIVYVWLEAQLLSQTMITRIIGRHTKVTFGGEARSLSLRYDPHLGMFVAADAQGRLFRTHPAVQLITPEVL